MQTARDLHDQIIETEAQITEGIGHDMKDLDPTQGVFNPNAALRDLGIEAFVGRGQFATFRLLLRLKGHHVGWFVSLKTGVLPQLTAGRENKRLSVRQRLIVLFAGHGGTEHLDFAGPLVTDDVILDGVPFLLTAVGLALVVCVFRATHRAFGAIDDELQARTRREHLFRRLRRACGQLALVAQRLVQYWRQSVNPDVAWAAPSPKK